MRLVYFVIQKYFPNYTNDEDIKQVGMIGLIKAVDTWDEAKSKFSTYASTCISNEIRYYFRRNNKHMGVLSLNAMFDIGDDEYVEFEEVTVGEEDVSLTPYCYERFYESLSDREKLLIDLSPMYNQSEIGKALGISQPQVARIKKTLKEKWRTFNGEDSY